MSRGREGQRGRDEWSGEATAGAVAAALYERYSEHVRRLCVRRLGDDEAADAVQDTFLRAWLALRDGAEVRHPLPWLLTIADNVCVSRFRARGARVVTTALSEHAAMAHSPAPTDDEGLAAAIRELPKRQRQAFLRRELQGFSYDEIGAELGLSRASVAALLHRARRTVTAIIRGGIPAVAPVPEVVRAIHSGGVNGIVALGSTAAVAAVAVTQLAGPAPKPVPETAVSQAPRVLAIAPPSSRQVVRLSPPQATRPPHGARLAARPTIRRQATRQTPNVTPSGGPHVFVWQPSPRIDLDFPSPPSPPLEEVPPADHTPEGPAETTPPTGEPEPQVDTGEEVDTGPAGQPADDSSGDAGSHHDESSSAPSDGEQPSAIPGLANGAEPGPSHAAQAGTNGGNGKPSQPGASSSAGGPPPSTGTPPGGEPGAANQHGPPQGGSGGKPHGSKPKP